MIGSSGDDNIKGSAYIFNRNGTVWTQQQKLTANDGVANDEFGNSVAISGGTILVGSSGDAALRGAIYVYVLGGNGWAQQQKLIATDGKSDDSFGWSIAISGKTAIVGSFLDEDDPNTDSGSAYIIRILDPFFGDEILVTPPTSDANDLFGISVSISGNTAIVGASGDNSAQGTAHIYVRNGCVWAEQQILNASDGVAGDTFGNSVSINGDTAIVGAKSKASGRGSAYVFVRNGTTWTPQQILNASDGAAGDNFGESISISGDTAIIGASGDDTARGSAYVYVRSGTTWTQQQKLLASDGVSNDKFGASVSINFESVIVGANGDDGSRGSAYVFTRNGTTWSPQQKLLASDGVVNDLFGKSVSISFDSAVVGASGDDSSKGAAYVFARNGINWTQQQKLTASDGASNDQFGFSSAIDGDIVIIGANQNLIGSNSNQGSSYVFLRYANSFAEIQNTTASDGQTGDGYGHGVAVSGDKLLIGAPFKDIASPARKSEANLAGVDQGAVYFRVNQFLVPTAATATISGRVLSPNGRGISRAVVHITDQEGNILQARSNQFGYYHFEAIPVGETYIFNVYNKQYQFETRVVNISENLTNFDFRAQN